MQNKKICHWCKKSFYTGKNGGKTYCSNGCSQRAFKNAETLMEAVTIKKGVSGE